MSGDQQWKHVIKLKAEQERIMIACHASPEGKSSGLARIQNFKVGVQIRAGRGPQGRPN